MSMGRRWKAVLIFAYLTLLAASHVKRVLDPYQPPPRPGLLTAQVARVGDKGAPVEIAYRRGEPETPVSRDPLLLIHGSPGGSGDFGPIGRILVPDGFAFIAPDLPGFGRSTHDIPDYSIQAHARYLLELMDALRIPQAHLVGYSMGGGVALEMADMAPGRVRSLTLLSSIGVQELELFGEYRLNHLVHGLQFALLWLLEEATPHFGYFDDDFLNVEYARNFYDSDQRPLRGILEGCQGPMLILHAHDDPLVPEAAAIEHHRIVPQSELRPIPDSHFTLFVNPRPPAVLIEDFVQRVERGQAIVRADAEPDRIAASRLPFRWDSVPPATGMALIVLMLSIVGASFVSEDLTLIGVGFLAGAGRIDFFWGTLACFIGLYIGDMGVFWIGRLLGRPLLRFRVVRWFISPEAVERSSRWLSKRGPIVIFISRFVPGSRLPTYLAAGMLRTSFWRFAFYFFIPTMIWTPALVGLSMKLGPGTMSFIGILEDYAWLAFLVIALMILTVTRVIFPLATHRGRRLFKARFTRLRRWEFWPPWAFYPPMVLYVLWLGIKHRSLTLFTAANPGIPEGGFVYESKSAILEALGTDSGDAARFRLLSDPSRMNADEVQAFLTDIGSDYPVVLKPDRGERGRGVSIAGGRSEVEEYFRGAHSATIAQEYVPGREFGVFYYRLPGNERGGILSITRKILPSLRGDGRSTVEELILEDDRAVCLTKVYSRNLADRLEEVPAPGQEIPLAQLGTHCRGAIFLDACNLADEGLRQTMDRIGKRFQGFYFGRYDVKADSDEALRLGQVRVLELNGVTSEATHIYDPEIELRQAYRVLARQWRLAFLIGAENVRRGHRPASLTGLMSHIIDFLILKRFRRSRSADVVPGDSKAQRQSG